MSEANTNQSAVSQSESSIVASSPPTKDAAKESSSSPSELIASVASASDSIKVDASKDEPKVEVAKPEDKISSKFAALSRKEREVYQKKQELKAEEARIAELRSKDELTLKEARAQIESERKEIEEFRALKKDNPLKVLEKLGITYQQLTDIVLNEGKPTPEQLLQNTKEEFESKFSALKREQEEKEKAADARRAAEEEKAKKALDDEQKEIEAKRVEALDNFKSEIDEYVSEKSEEYELTHLNGASHLIFDTIEKYFEETASKDPNGVGKVLTIKEAADAVEHYLEMQVEKNLATKKLKAKASPQPTKEDPSVKPQANATPSTKTLNNDLASSATVPASAARTEEERMRRAIAAMTK